MSGEKCSPTQAWMRPVLGPLRQLLMSGIWCDVQGEKEPKMTALAAVRNVLLQQCTVIRWFSLRPITQILCTPPFCSPQSSSCSSCKHNKYVPQLCFSSKKLLVDLPVVISGLVPHTTLHVQCWSCICSPTATGHIHIPWNWWNCPFPTCSTHSRWAIQQLHLRPPIFL